MVHQLRLRWVGDRCPSLYLFEIECHVLLNLVIQTPCLTIKFNLFESHDFIITHSPLSDNHVKISCKPTLVLDYFRITLSMLTIISNNTTFEKCTRDFQSLDKYHSF